MKYVTIDQTLHLQDGGTVGSPAYLKNQPVDQPSANRWITTWSDLLNDGLVPQVTRVVCTVARSGMADDYGREPMADTLDY